MKRFLFPFIFLSGCFILFGDDDGLKRCQSDWECGPLFRCSQVTEDDFVCLSKDPGEAAAMMGVFLNKKAAKCAAEGHDVKGVRVKTHKMPTGKPGCTRVWKTQQCRRCLSDIPAVDSNGTVMPATLEGDCEGC